MGHDIDLFTSQFPNCKKEEILDNMRIIRDGSKYSVYRRAKQYYKRCADRYDFVIDEINTRPFMSPQYVKDKPIVSLIHQLARETWFHEISFPINLIGYYYLELKWLSLYKNIPTITVSLSTKLDLERIGFRNVSVVHQGLSVRPRPSLGPKEVDPTVVFIGRLTKAKLPDHALRAYPIIKREIPNLKMWIIGNGPLKERLEANAEPGITFFGHVDNQIKYELLSRAHLLLVPAIREGWGLVVTEANAMGTPAIAYDVPGLRDSVINGETGLLLKENSPNMLATTAVNLLKDCAELSRYSLNSLYFSRKFNWNRTTKEFDAIVNEVDSNRHQPRA